MSNDDFFITFILKICRNFFTLYALGADNRFILRPYASLGQRRGSSACREPRLPNKTIQKPARQNLKKPNQIHDKRQRVRHPDGAIRTEGFLKAFHF